MIVKKTDKIGFGKYKGKTVQEILEDDPTYVRWLIDNVETFKMSPEDTRETLDRATEADLIEYDDYYGTIDIYDYCD